MDVGRVDAGGVERADDLEEARARPDRDRDLGPVGVDARRGRPRSRRARRTRSRGPRATATVTATRSPPTRCFSAAGEPAATSRPWSSTTMSSARRSASSRYWVVRISVAPFATRSRSRSHSSLRACGSSPVVGSSRNRTGAQATRLAARSSRRRMPPEKVRASLSATSVSPTRSSSSSARRRALGARKVVEPADQLEVRAGGQQAVDGRGLARQPDPRAHARPRRLTTSSPATRAAPVVGRGQRGEDADGRGLARAVVAEQTEDRAGGDLEVEVAQRPQLVRSACRGPRRRRRSRTLYVDCRTSYEHC